MPGPSKTHTIEELEEIRHAIENSDRTHTDAQHFYDITPDFEDIRILPNGKQHSEAHLKGKPLTTQADTKPTLAVLSGSWSRTTREARKNETTAENREAVNEDQEKKEADANDTG
ncbi:hypothetical protein CHS0354_035091 [Potamilus streckersoni]|uniref:Uncharacterized protein n=1 Tax=Potamilus streckersoni TaxID=2493646 RepID=A0AAE0VRC1_9BIVA|nr:hypothetical protein CHS0354_035091 [Potamilus streckersoni]